MKRHHENSLAGGDWLVLPMSYNVLSGLERGLFVRNHGHHEFLIYAISIGLKLDIQLHLDAGEAVLPLGVGRIRILELHCVLRDDSVF